MPTPKQIDKLLQERYYLSTETTWEQVAERISKLHPPILDYIKNKEFIPSSPTIMNANTDGERYGTLSSCFPMKIEDSIDGIMDTMKEIAQVTKMGGGCGLMFDNIRGANEMISSVGKNSGGSIPFIAMYNSVLDGIMQGSCLTTDTLVSTTQGLLRMDEIVDVDVDGWQTKNNELYTTSGIFPSTRVFNNGVSDVYKLTTKNRNTIKATKNHKFFVYDTIQDIKIWKELQEITKDDFIMFNMNQYDIKNDVKLTNNAVSTDHFNVNKIEVPTTLTEELSYILGYFYGNGYMTKKDDDFRFGFSIPHGSFLIEELPKMLKRCFIGDYKITKLQKKNDKSITYQIGSKQIKRFLKENGFDKKDALDISVPFNIRTAKREIIYRFIEGYFEADGNASSNKRPSVSSASEKMIRELSILLFNIGCPNSILEIKPTHSSFGTNSCFELTVVTSYGIRNFYDNILKEKKSRFNNRNDKKINNRRGFILPNTTEIFEDLLESQEYKDNTELQKEIRPYLNKHKYFSLFAFENLSKKYEFFDDYVSIDTNIYYSQVDSIDIQENKELTLDIEVTDKHEYIANGIVVHNSRRGAGMSMMDIYHPDILSFITAKIGNDKFNRSNFSIRIPDVFYKILNEDPNRIFKTINIVDKKENILIDLDGKEMTYKMIWDKIIDSAWLSAEPGIFNSDIAFNQCTVTNIDNEVLSNPCLPKSAKILTEYGITTLDKINVGDKIWSKDGWTTVLNKWSSGIKDVYKYIDEKDNILYCTNNHKISSNGKKVEAKDAKYLDVFISNDAVEIESNIIISSYIISTEEVFDITVDNDTHSFWCNGVDIFNCGEFCNIPYLGCGLGSIDVSRFIIDGIFDKKSYIKVIQKSSRFLDSAIDVNNFPLDKITDRMMQARPIGLGFMGLSHAMFKLGIPYESDKGLEFTKDIIKTLTLESMRESIEIAKVDGAYPAFEYELYVKANARLFNDNEFQELLPDIKKYGVRNSSHSSIAPTGSISFIANTSSGIEPVFALAYTRRIEKIQGEFEEVYQTDDVFESFLDNNYSDKKEEILKEVISNNGSCQKSKILSDKDKSIFKTATDLTPMEHLETLAIVSKYVSLSTSKTINLPKDISKEKVSEVYLEAHKRGIIGVTVYRDGSRDGILITSKKDTDVNEPKLEAGRHSPKRPSEIECEVNIPTVNKKQYYVIIGVANGNPYEVFTGENYNSKGEIFIPKSVKKGIIKKLKKGNYIFIDENNNEYNITNGHSIPEAESLSRQISLNLRHNIPIQYIVEQLLKGNTLVSFHKAIARTLKKYIKDETESSEKCPMCKSKLQYVDGCVSCIACGFSKCS